MSEKLVKLDEIARTTLRLFGVNKINILKRDTTVIEDNIYLYNNKYYKCIKNGVQSLPTTEYFQEIKIKTGVLYDEIKKKLAF